MFSVILNILTFIFFSLFLNFLILYLSKTNNLFTSNMYNLFLRILKNTILIIFFIEIFHFFTELNKLQLKTILLLIFIIIVIIILNIFKKQVFLKALKKNSNFKKFYKTYRNSLIFKKSNAELLNLSLIFVMQKFIFVYKEYPLILFLILVLYSYFIKNILLLSIFCCHWLYDEVIALPYFSKFKKTREEDIRRFNFHWNFDRDLVFLNKVLIVSYSIGFGITYFSYFFYYTTLGELGVKHSLLLLNYTLSIKDIQYFLAMNLIGPSVLILCIVLKLLLNMHVIFFRNPSTILKGFASLATTKNIAGFSTFVLTFSGTFLGFNCGYHASIGPQNTIKNLSDFMGDGVVRHTPFEDQAFY